MIQIPLDIGLPTGPTLANFCSGSNLAAVRYMEQWVNAKPDGASTPVPTYLWGPEGSGKSHLLKAAREALRERGARVGWLDASTLELPEYDEAWAAVLLDDVDAFTPDQQQHAFNWFVNAQSYQCPVLAAGAMAVVDLPLREDVRTRLGWGHIFQLQVLSDQERRAVLCHEADARGLVLRDEVVDFMLTRFSRDLGHLMDLLNRLDNYALQTQRALTVPLIKSMLEKS